LKQLETVLEKFDATGSHDTNVLADRIAAVRSRLASETTSVDMFLDTVQLHNPANAAPEVAIQGGDESNLEGIKDKVDNIAAKLFRRWDTRGDALDDEDRMWQEFKSELEMEGFSAQILQQHKVCPLLTLGQSCLILPCGTSANQVPILGCPSRIYPRASIHVTYQWRAAAHGKGFAGARGNDKSTTSTTKGTSDSEGVVSHPLE
jgi:hypothetical protein